MPDGRFYAQRHAHSLQPSAQAILGEQAEGATRLLSGMQAKLQEQERQQRIAIPLPLRPTGHANGPDGPDRPGGLGRKAGPLGQCAAGVQPARHPPGDAAAGAGSRRRRCSFK